MTLTCTQIIEELEIMRSAFAKNSNNSDVLEAYDKAITSVKDAFSLEGLFYLHKFTENQEETRKVCNHEYVKFDKTKCICTKCGMKSLLKFEVKKSGRKRD